MVNHGYEIGFLIREINNQLSRWLVKACKENEVRGRIQGMILRYLSLNTDKKIIQKDLEKQFAVRAPTMSNLLSSLENDGFIYRSKGEDSRQKVIILTEKGLKEVDVMNSQIVLFEEVIKKDLSNKECETLICYLTKIIENIKEELRKE